MSTTTFHMFNEAVRQYREQGHLDESLMKELDSTTRQLAYEEALKPE